MKRMAKATESHYNTPQLRNDRDPTLHVSSTSSQGGSSPHRLAYALWYWAPVAAYAAVIFILSSISAPEMSLPFLFLWFPIPYGDKILHAVVYGGLALLALRAFRHAAGPKGAHYALGLAVVAAALYGVSDEIHQLFVPNRRADVWDWVADTGGALLATWGWTKCVATRRRLPGQGLPGPGISDPVG